MRKTSMTLSWEAERLAALKLYLEQKGSSVETELLAALEVLYVKTVPTNVREFIGLRSAAEKPTVRKKSPATEPPVEGGEDT